MISNGLIVAGRSITASRHRAWLRRSDGEQRAVFVSPHRFGSRNRRKHVIAQKTDATLADPVHSSRVPLPRIDVRGAANDRALRGKAEVTQHRILALLRHERHGVIDQGTYVGASGFLCRTSGARVLIGEVIDPYKEALDPSA